MSDNEKNDDIPWRAPNPDAPLDEARVLASVRKEIDVIDDELVDLLNRRARVSRRVGRIKARSGGKILKPGREKALLDKLSELNPGPLPDAHLRAIYREIISSSRDMQQRLKVVYLGPEGTFSYFAGQEYLGSSADYTPRPTIPGVFASVAGGNADYGVIPLENSLQGTVGQSLDCFQQYEVYIQSEILARISHSLLSTSDSLGDITQVYSHPQALEQCGGWLRANLPLADITPTESTAAAARMVVKKKNAAAIGHIKLAEMCGLKVLASPIEDSPDNWTRFFIIGTEPVADPDNVKTSILFTTANKPGSLANMLNVAAEEGVNLSKLESRPIKSEKWKYIFFADLDCDLRSEALRKALGRLEEACLTFRILGSYPQGQQIDVRHQA
ncbi:MAG: prephenate dehydratase [Desulfovibrio sp.]|uniref:prephenate dehydratase n=1 Tax=Desulfovibrio sp. 7SRBS1 TaxID=3378064 RepID=UPI003B4210B2